MTMVNTYILASKNHNIISAPWKQQQLIQYDRFLKNYFSWLTNCFEFKSLYIIKHIFKKSKLKPNIVWKYKKAIIKTKHWTNAHAYQGSTVRSVTTVLTKICIYPRNVKRHLKNLLHNISMTDLSVVVQTQYWSTLWVIYKLFWMFFVFGSCSVYLYKKEKI